MKYILVLTIFVSIFFGSNLNQNLSEENKNENTHHIQNINPDIQSDEIQSDEMQTDEMQTDEMQTDEMQTDEMQTQYNNFEYIQDDEFEQLSICNDDKNIAYLLMFFCIYIMYILIIAMHQDLQNSKYDLQDGERDHTVVKLWNNLFSSILKLIFFYF